MTYDSVYHTWGSLVTYVTINLGDAEVFILRLAAFAVAAGALWRLWGRPVQKRIRQALDEHSAMVALINAEFTVDGGLSMKDTMDALLKGQRDGLAFQRKVLDWMERHDTEFPNGHG